ncbi:MAG TPA: hypothetical protein VHO24_13945 [Opitutaceae bacterium]|nr:hypothetical protein [Opitutaceae bacterium]
MNPNNNTAISAASLLSLRQEADALRIITERLNVKQMGPADHIRTKHEVKAFIESAGDLKEAEAIIARAHTRRTLQETHEVTMKLTEGQRQGLRQ